MREQYDGRAGRCRVVGDDGRGAALADDLDVRETGRPRQLGDLPGAAVHLVAAGGVRPHRLDAHQIFGLGRGTPARTFGRSVMTARLPTREQT